MQIDTFESPAVMPRRAVVTCVVLLIAAAVAVRVYRIDTPPGDFQPARQYGLATTARAMYWLADPSTPEWKRAVAEGQMEQAVRIEPPLTEIISARAYRLLGGERIWVPRSMGVLAWLVGGVFLWLLVRRFLPAEAVLVSVGFYGLAPFGILMSRSLQPDALMVMGLLASAWATYWYFEAPSAWRLVASGLVAGAAVFLKPGASQFAVIGMFAALSIHREGARWTLADARVWLFAFLALAPAFVYYVLQMTEAVPLRDVLSGHFIPSLLGTVYFWRAWAGNLVDVLGLAVLAIGAIGVLLLPAGLPRSLAGGLAAGYVVQCLFDSLATAIQPSVHVHAIPLAALGLGALSVPVWDVLGRAVPRRALGVLAPLVLVAWFGLSLRGAAWLAAEYTGGDLPTIAAEIGEAVNHSTRTVFLDYNDGKPTCYFGLYAGRSWPETADQEFEGRFRIPAYTAAERFRILYAPDNPDFFIVSRNFQDLDRQPDLKHFLQKHFRELTRTPRYLIYDLKKPAK